MIIPIPPVSLSSSQSSNTFYAKYPEWLKEYHEVTNGLVCELKDWLQKKIVPDMLEPVTPALGDNEEWFE
jgi:hypothetical protein